ncbi:MAG TPA: malto-oligosyltrehalose trehalohydrolase [Miltoncostaeaceae bacterium]|nr:malto-oligosyltrehalose trehalohydrolase [Miltoncostaeaceae bacterium]
MSDAGGRLPWELPLGATPQADGTTVFRVWAPRASRVEVEVDGLRTPLDEELGVFTGRLDAGAGDRYRYVLDGGDPLPDPCSRFQPEGVRGPSEIVDPAAWTWTDAAWPGLDHDGLVVYEMHVGTFTPEGTFAAAAERLPALRELGVTAVELMPVATFPGDRNWGYDGLYTWAAHPAYGGPAGLAAFVDAAHAAGLGVILDVVYNHIGPGSETIDAFGPYLTDRYGTPWGRAVNFDDAGCGGVREWAIQNAEMWVRELHVDGLRVDAVHAIFDAGARHVLAELCDRVRAAAGVPPILIAESDLNDPRTVTPAGRGGWGFDAQWSDDFHHALHALTTGEGDGYYADFGGVGHLAGATARPFVYDGRYSAHRGRRHGAPADGIPASRFVVSSQNHDQVGNRAFGDRPPAETLPLRAMWTILSPWIPMLFMGEEHGERRPFAFFTDHIDAFIANATREGRRREFAAFTGFAEERIPDPQDPETARRSVIDPDGGDPAVRELHRRLLALRRELPAAERRLRSDGAAGWIGVARGDVEMVGNFGENEVEVQVDGRTVVLATHEGVGLRDGVLRLPPLAGAVVR